MQQIIGRGSVIVFGGGKQTRDYVYIDDVVDALISASTAGAVDQEIINVGSGQETSMQQLIEQIAATMHAHASVIENTEASGGIQHLVADLTKARQLLKYKPRTLLSDGLRKFYELDARFGARSSVGKVSTH